MKRKIIMNRSNSGITLVALVITIIVLLILAGISISLVLGDNGILKKSQQAKSKTERAEIVEIAKIDVNDRLIENHGSITEEELETILTSDEYKTQGTLSDNGESSILEKTLTSHDGNYQILVSEIYNGPFARESSVSGQLISEVFESNGNTEDKMHVGDYIDFPVYYDNVPAYCKNQWGSQFSGYSSIEAFANDTNVIKHYIADNNLYNGWKLHSVTEENGETVIKIVTAGVPMNYLFKNISRTGIYDLTVGFFDTQITSSLDDYGFYDIGFKSSGGTKATNMTELKALFNNGITATYQEGEIATFTNNSSRGVTTTVTNENVAGYPKVHCITEEEGALQYPPVPASGDLSSYYVPTWFPSYAGTSLGGEYLSFYTHEGTYRNNDGTQFCLYGIQIVAELRSDARFTLSEDNNGVKVWSVQ